MWAKFWAVMSLMEEAHNIFNKVIQNSNQLLRFNGLHLWIQLQRMLRIFRKLSIRVCNKMWRTIPGFDLVMNKLQADIAAREVRKKEVSEARKKALVEAALRRSNPGYQPWL